MKLYLIFTKKGLAVVLSLIITAFILVGWFSTVKLGLIDGTTHQKRMEYLASLNLKVNENAVLVKQTRLPEKIEGFALEYNKIQQKAGFDLEDFRGKAVTVYRYELSDNPTKAVSIFVCNGKIIAGDITDNLNGKISSLIKEK